MDFKDIEGREVKLTKKTILSVHGEPGVGKTPCIKLALESNGIPYYMVPVSSQPLQWFDGYKGEPVIWCDDTVLGNPNVFLNLLQADKLQIKGGYVSKDSYRTRWIISNNVSLRGQFRQYNTPEDKARIEAIMARTIEIMMYPNEELQATQKQPYVFRGKIIDSREEFGALCRGVEEKEVHLEKIKQSMFELIKQRFEEKDPLISMTIDGYVEDMGVVKILHREGKNPEVLPS